MRAAFVRLLKRHLYSIPIRIFGKSRPSLYKLQDEVFWSSTYTYSPCVDKLLGAVDNLGDNRAHLAEYIFNCRKVLFFTFDHYFYRLNVDTETAYLPFKGA